MTQSDDSNRLIDAGNQERGDNALRPTSLVDFIGQGNGRRNLETFIHAARDRGDVVRGPARGGEGDGGARAGEGGGLPQGRRVGGKINAHTPDIGKRPPPPRALTTEPQRPFQASARQGQNAVTDQDMGGETFGEKRRENRFGDVQAAGERAQRRQD